MNTVDFVILGVLIVCVIAALWKCIVNFKRGKGFSGCCGECSSCSGRCSCRGNGDKQ